MQILNILIVSFLAIASTEAFSCAEVPCEELDAASCPAGTVYKANFGDGPCQTCPGCAPIIARGEACTKVYVDSFQYSVGECETGTTCTKQPYIESFENGNRKITLQPSLCL